MTAHCPGHKYHVAECVPCQAAASQEQRARINAGFAGVKAGQLAACREQLTGAIGAMREAVRVLTEADPRELQEAADQACYVLRNAAGGQSGALSSPSSDLPKETP